MGKIYCDQWYMIKQILFNAEKSGLYKFETRFCNRGDLKAISLILFSYFANFSSLNLNQLENIIRSIFQLVHSRSSSDSNHLTLIRLIHPYSFSSNRILSSFRPIKLLPIMNKRYNTLTCINVSRDHQKLSSNWSDFELKYRWKLRNLSFSPKTQFLRILLIIFVVSDFNVIFRIFVNRTWWRLSAGLRKRSNCSWFVVCVLMMQKEVSWFGATLGVLSVG